MINVLPQMMAEDIIADLCDRSLGIDSLDDDMVQEIKEAIVEIIQRRLLRAFNGQEQE